MTVPAENFRIPALPDNLLFGLDPSACSYADNKMGKPEALASVKSIPEMRIRPFDAAVMMFLAAYGCVGSLAMQRLLTCVPEGAQQTGFDGLLEELMERFGVEYDIKRVFGTLHRDKSAYDKLRQCARKGLVRTMMSGSTSVRVRTELVGSGIDRMFVLTPLGARVLANLSTHDWNDKRVCEEMKFEPSGHKVSIKGHLHDLGLSTFLVQTCVLASYYTNARGVFTDVCRTLGEGTEYKADGRKFCPDLAGVILVKKAPIPYMLEWESGTSKGKQLDKRIEDKVLRFFRLMNQVDDTRWTAGYPWLLFAAPDSDKHSTRKRYERLIRNAAKQMGWLNWKNPDRVAGVAFASHGDIGERGVYGNVWHVYDHDSGELTTDGYSLASLNRKAKPAQGTLDTPASSVVPTQRPSHAIESGLVRGNEVA